MKKFLTINEVAKMLNVSQASVYHRIMAKEINFYKIGRSVRICEDDLNKYFEESKTNVIKSWLRLFLVEY